MKKIAILGGGCGSMATAFALTEKPGWKDDYEITVYQMGWRLGGKGASGRGPNGRIEEHGLHIWLGFYDNAFGVMQRAYAEMNRPEGAPLREWQDAFKKHSFIVLEEQTSKGWRNWPMDFPENGLLPGPGTPLPSLWDYIGMALSALETHFADSLSRHPILHEGESLHDRINGILHGAEFVLDMTALTAGASVLYAARRYAEAMPHNPEEHSPADHSRLVQLLSEMIRWLWDRIEQHTDEDDELRRLFITIDLAVANVKGVLAEGVMKHPDGLDLLDKYEYREFLKLYGASDLSLSSAPLKGLYDLVFGYENGDVTKPNFAAGAALRSVLRMGFGYKGAIFWKMQAGMGDTVFTPLYIVLKERGVKFEFFHRVRNLGLAANEPVVDTITIGCQATLKAEYDPFVEVEDLPCWPSQANFEQLVEGDELKAQNINLESFWTPWPDVETKILKRGVDFDEIVLGISIGAFPYIAPELAARSKPWSDMVTNVGTVRTQSMQLWLKPNIAELGWTLASPVMDAYVDDMNTWADMTHLIPHESYPADSVGSIAYYCGPMLGGIPDPSDTGAPKAAYDEVRAKSQKWLETSSGYLWPKGATPSHPAGLDWDLLVDTNGGEGLQRLDSQYFRANLDPSERYVLSLKGSTPYRLRAGESGFTNLFLTGDWTQNEFNAGCVEATVMSGMLCANAMTGYPPLSDISGADHP